MDNNLYKKVENIIRNDTGLGVARIGVIDIYDKLKAAGLEVSEPEIAETLEALVKEKRIEIERQVSPEDNKKHGTYVITWVSARL